MDFTSFPTNILFLPTSNPGSYIEFSCHVTLVSFSLWQFLSLSLPLMTLGTFESTGQVYWRISMNLDLSNVFSWLYCDYTVSGKIPQKWYILFSVWYIYIYVVCKYILLLVVLIFVIHLVKEMSAIFLHCNVTIFSLYN